METPVRIELEGGERLRLTWEQGADSDLSARQLRAACQCAGCREPAGVAATQAVLAADTPISIVDARLVGGYAISFQFAPDGHSTGIYPYEVLRSLATESGDDAAS